jgi:ABC-2 type transport system permease protein
MTARPPGLLTVALRELDWLRRDGVALTLVLAVPLLAIAVLSLTFSNAVIRNLRVDVVDQDQTRSSMTVVQAVNAAPGLEVTRRSGDLDGAMHAVRSGEAIGAVYIPRGLERDIADGKRPQIVVFHNKQYYTPGNIASGALAASVAAAVVDLGTDGGHAMGYAPGPLAVEQYVLTNPALNYVQFLLRAILPMVLHVVTAIAGGYAVGSEYARRDFRDWMAAADGDPLTALVGKLAPYLGILTMLMVVIAIVVHGVFEVSFRGDSLLLGIAACVLLWAYLSVGALFQLLVRNLAFGLSLTGIFCSPAFGFVGVGFPLLAMSGFARSWGDLLPLRWYMQILSDQAARGVPAEHSVEPFAVLAGLAMIYFALAALRLRSIARKALPGDEHDAEPPVRPGVVGAFVAEYGRALRERGAFSLIVLAPVIYGAFYPQPYLGQLVRAIPIAVVDDDSSEVSRRLVQALNAHEAVRVAARPSTLAEAHAALARREVYAIVDIPAGTEREVLAGRRARVPAYVDSVYFLLYNRTVQGIVESSGAVTAELLSGDSRPDGSLYRAALARSSPVEVLNQPLFNPTGGYASYIVPAAFMLILQQTLFMGVATLGAARRHHGSAATVVGRGLAHLLLALPGAILFLVVLPRIYGFSATTAHLGDLLALLLPFMLSVSFLGQFVSSWFRHRETAVLLFIATSLPLFFLIGVAWPVEAIPPLVHAVAYVFPSTSAIDGLVRINQMDASFADAFRDWMRLWVLTALYLALAVGGAKLSVRAGAGDARTA